MISSENTKSVSSYLGIFFSRLSLIPLLKLNPEKLHIMYYQTRSVKMGYFGTPQMNEALEKKIVGTRAKYRNDIILRP